MLVRDLIEKVHTTYTENVKFLSFETEMFIDQTSYVDIFLNDYKIKDEEVQMFTWYQADLWIYI